MSAREATSRRCPTPCDDDCEATCHEGHNVYWQKGHPDEWCQLTDDQRRTLNDLSRALHRLGDTTSTFSADNAETEAS